MLFDFIIVESCPKIISRSEWRAQQPNCTYHLSTPVTYAVIHHTAGSPCSTRLSCISQVKSIQKYHMTHNRWCDIGYSFLIGGDGNIYEGAGWDNRGTHTANYNIEPSMAAQNAAKSLIGCARSKNKLQSDYVLKGHRDTKTTLCPGDKLYRIIQSWPNYKA
ncbi:peptidoglycan recognition protein 1-like [Protopterus annectens]|uniref:peptidoglycan recognition protein 1-like n=1 Tax=Protopterus annectens TaxID=7888 RepID=UPI001CFA092F|nr:peptidoglycan recognition protein 1-like [Protopterus annectens]